MSTSCIVSTLGLQNRARHSPATRRGTDAGAGLDVSRRVGQSDTFQGIVSPEPVRKAGWSCASAFVRIPDRHAVDHHSHERRRRRCQDHRRPHRRAPAVADEETSVSGRAPSGADGRSSAANTGIRRLAVFGPAAHRPSHRRAVLRLVARARSAFAAGSIHSRDVLDASSSLLVSLLDAEIVERGLRCSRATRPCLAPYYSAPGRAPTACVRRLRALTRDNTLQRARLDTLALRVRDRLSWLDSVRRDSRRSRARCRSGRGLVVDSAGRAHETEDRRRRATVDLQHSDEKTPASRSCGKRADGAGRFTSGLLSLGTLLAALSRASRESQSRSAPFATGAPRSPTPRTRTSSFRTRPSSSKHRPTPRKPRRSRPSGDANEPRRDARRPRSPSGAPSGCRRRRRRSAARWRSAKSRQLIVDQAIAGARRAIPARSRRSSRARRAPFRRGAERATCKRRRHDLDPSNRMSDVRRGAHRSGRPRPTVAHHRARFPGIVGPPRAGPRAARSRAFRSQYDGQVLGATARALRQPHALSPADVAFMTRCRASRRRRSSARGFRGRA